MIRKKYFSLIVLLVFCMIFSGCSSNVADAEPEVNEVEEPAVEPEEPLKVAFLLDGPINDQGWNSLAYEGMLMAQENLGIEGSYAESVQQSDNEEVIRNYIANDFDVIYAHGYNFTDACLLLAPEFPEIIFFIGGVDVSAEPNLASLNVDNYEQGFMQGVIAAILSESNQIGAVSGMEIPPITAASEGFVAGALYARPDIDVVTAFTGDFVDAAKVKETANAMIDQGCDVIMVDCGSANLGGLEAAEEAGVMLVGSNTDMNPQAPDTVVTTVIDDFSIGIGVVIEDILAGTFMPQMYNYGIIDGVTYMTPYHSFEETLSQDIKNEIEEIYMDIKSGDFSVHDL